MPRGLLCDRTGNRVDDTFGGKLAKLFPGCQSIRSMEKDWNWSAGRVTIETEFQSAEAEVPMVIVPLEMMSSGEQGRVSALDGSPEFVVRLEEMGLREGVRIRMVQPGCPCILAVNDHRFSLRFDNRATVLVELSQ